MTMNAPRDSLSAWARVTSNPGDEHAWTDFYEHYWDVIFRWAFQRTGDAAAADEIATDVFESLHRRISDPERTPIQPNADGSFRPYIQVAVLNSVRNYRRGQARRREVELSEEVLARLEDSGSVKELEDRMAEREELEQVIDRFRGRFQAAVRALKADPQFNASSFDVFVRVHKKGERPSAVDESTGQKPGHASKTSNRVRERLIHLMGLREESRSEEQARTILQGLLRADDGPLVG